MILTTLQNITRTDRLDRELKAVQLMAASGLSTVQELAEELAKQQSRNSSGSFRRIFTDYLPEDGLAEYKVLPIFRAGLGVVRLTLRGIRLAQQTQPDAPIKLSDWQLLIDGHHGELQPEHTAMILAFAREARYRGYTAKILPAPLPVIDPDTNKSVAYQPDLSVTHPQYGQWYVEVQRHSRARPGKWLRQMLHQNAIAFVTLTTNARKTLMRHITEQHSHTYSYATDLQTLMRARAKNRNNDMLWYEINM